MTDRCKYRIPVAESIFAQNCIQILRFRIVYDLETFCPGILRKHFLALEDIIFF